MYAPLELELWHLFRDHVLGTRDGLIPGCVTCDHSRGVEEFCCEGYRLWSNVPAPIQKRVTDLIVKSQKGEE